MSKKATQTRPAPLKRSYLWLIGALAALLILAVIFLRPGVPSTTALPPNISVAEAKQKYDAGVFLLDVRQPEEWNQVHIPNTTLIPLGELAGRVSELPKDKPIVVVCRSGNRSQQGRDILLQAGFADIASMTGGLNQWTAAGYPTVSGP